MCSNDPRYENVNYAFVVLVFEVHLFLNIGFLFLSQPKRLQRGMGWEEEETSNRSGLLPEIDPLGTKILRSLADKA